ncbi:hypothetical protein WL1483_3623 [Aeromonas schubertii]|uniref:Uncharacterized protein n=1 Tax=Aeromonas schubertii TaxID=652 RepID=A0A0S2SMZ7_9GAMM|nr:hypothetical protein WL1483_3623 [Aeromonas schubertii]
MAHQAIDQASGRSTGEEGGEGGVARPIAEGGPMERGGGRLVAEQKRRSGLDTARPQGQCGPHPPGIHDATGGDDGDTHGIDHGRQQGEEAVMEGEILRQEVAPVPPRLQSLGDDDVCAVRLQPARLGHRGRRGEHLASPLFDPLYLLGRGEPEVKAHQRRTVIRQDGGLLLGEGVASTRGDGTLLGEPQLLVGRGQGVPPAGQAARLGGALAVAEEVDVEGPLGVRLHPFQLLTQLIRGKHGRRQGADGAGLADGQGQAMILHAGHGGLNEGRGAW